MQNGTTFRTLCICQTHLLAAHTTSQTHMSHTHTLAHTHTFLIVDSCFWGRAFVFFAHVATVWDCLLPHHHHVPQKLAKCLASLACAQLSSALLGSSQVTPESWVESSRATRHAPHNAVAVSAAFADWYWASWYPMRCVVLRFVRSGSQSHIGQRLRTELCSWWATTAAGAGVV